MVKPFFEIKKNNSLFGFFPYNSPTKGLSKNVFNFILEKPTGPQQPR
jgi:hypothetical protein